MPKNHKLPEGKPVPPSYKKFWDMAFFHKPTWKQRFQIFFGYRVRIHMAIASEWSPGATDARMKFETTPDLKPNVTPQP